MSKPLTFVLNDETKVNSYGFRVLNAGLNLDRFKENAVLLVQHYNDVMNVVGRVINLRLDDVKLLGDLEFDLEDEQAKRLAGKVERGFIKGCSIGLIFKREDMTPSPDGNYQLNASELMEVSLVAVPSNANAIRLFAVSGELLSDTEVKLSIQQLQKTEIDNHKNMEKFILSALALTAMGLSVTPENSAELSAGIESLTKKLNDAQAELLAEKAKVSDLGVKLSAQAKANAEALVDQAILEGKLTADVKDQFVEMGTANLGAITKVLAGIPAKANLAGKVTGGTGLAGNEEVKDLEAFQKLSTEKQLAFKNEQPDAYQALFA